MIIDSSKHISRSFILNRYFDLHIIFIKRSFSGILNSSKKSARKNLKKGYEHSIKPKSSIKMFFIYIFNNLINSILINFFKKSYTIKFEDFVSDPTLIESQLNKWGFFNLNSKKKINNKAYFSRKCSETKEKYYYRRQDSIKFK